MVGGGERYSTKCQTYLFLVGFVCSEMMSADAGPALNYTQPRNKMRDEYSSMDVSSDSAPSNVKELDDNLRPTMDREGK